MHGIGAIPLASVGEFERDAAEQRVLKHPARYMCLARWKILRRLALFRTGLGN